MFRFEHPIWLWFLLLLPLLYVAYRRLRTRRERTRRRLVDAPLRGVLFGEFPERRRRGAFWACLGGTALCLLAAANPQMGGRAVTVQQRGLDVVLALDLSTSMLAEDVPPNRLERTKRWTQGLVERLSGNRIGLVVFAQEAFLEDALTLDYRHLLTSLRAQRPSALPQQGTDLALALDRIVESFPEERRNQRVAVLLTDGEHHTGDLDTALDRARAAGVLVFTVGVGSAEGGRIPVTFNGRRDFKRDESGQIVTTRPDVDLLQRIASATDGTYFDLRAGDAIYAALDQRLERLQKQDFEERLFSDYESYFGWLLLPGMLLLLLGFWFRYGVVRTTPVAVRP